MSGSEGNRIVHIVENYDWWLSPALLLMGPNANKVMGALVIVSILWRQGYTRGVWGSLPENYQVLNYFWYIL